MNDPVSTRRTYPLALLFLILTSSAVLAAVAAPLIQGLDIENVFDSLPELIGVLLGSMIGGAIMGLNLGLFQFHRLSGVICGLLVGAVIGPLAALLMTVQTSKISALVQAVLIGSAILLLVAWLIRPAIPTADDEVFRAVLAVEKSEQSKPAEPGQTNRT